MSRVQIEKLILTQLAKKFRAVSAPYNPLPYLQEPATGPHAEPVESSSQIHNLIIRKCKS
jgi:hypothetical protein